MKVTFTINSEAKIGRIMDYVVFNEVVCAIVLNLTDTKISVIDVDLLTVEVDG